MGTCAVVQATAKLWSQCSKPLRLCVEIEKTAVLSAPIERVWLQILDPKVMAMCVPGMQSIDVISDTEYLASLKVKISFISASFKIRTLIESLEHPTYLKTTGTGEDAALASSLKHQSEVFLSELPNQQTEFKIHTKVEIFGRVGTFGLSAMKTKADRMWDEFVVNLQKSLATS
jgi:carbon monoxide dehydrogenase subunit G